MNLTKRQNNSGLQLDEGKVQNVMNSICKIHWLNGGRSYNNDGGSFIVRFNSQDSIDLINRNLFNLKQFRVKRPDGRENFVKVRADQTKEQRDEESLLVRARAILRDQRSINSKLHSNGRGHYLLIDGEKHFSDSRLVQDALKAGEAQNRRTKKNANNRHQKD